jgi:hypothetical protein
MAIRRIQPLEHNPHGSLIFSNIVKVYKVYATPGKLVDQQRLLSWPFDICACAEYRRGSSPPRMERVGEIFDGGEMPENLLLL